MLKRFAFLFALLTGIISLQAAGFPKPTFTASFSKSNAKAGDIVELIIKFDVAAGFHVYSEKSDCPEDDGPIRASIDFTPNSNYQLVGKFYGVGDKMVKETEVFNCATGEFTGKGEFRQKIKVLKAIPAGGIEMIFNGQICNEGGCDNIRNVKITSPALTVTGSIAASVEATSTPTNAGANSGQNTDPAATSTENSETVEAQTNNPTTSTSNTNTITSDAGYKTWKSGEKKMFTGKSVKDGNANEDGESYWGLFLLAFISGLAALLTPCVFPMIPMTVAFFIKSNNNRAAAIRDASVFALSIIAIYTVLGTITAMVFGPQAANWLSTHWIPNIFFTVIFLVFAASFFGAFEIVLPAWIVNKMDSKSNGGGIAGSFFMAITIALVSFSCTGPIVGTVLVEAVHGGAGRPIIGMFGFSLAFALPFGLLAMFPNLMKNLPKSGGWLNSVKVVLGFIEVAFALKFLSIPDQTYHWGILDREIYLSIWIVIFFLLGLYLLGKLKFPHDSDVPHVSILRLFLAIASFSFVVYMLPGMWGAPLKGLAGYMPPLSTQDFNSNLKASKSGEGNIANPPSYTNTKLHIPHDIAGYFDYDEALAAARTLNKPLFIDFTGHGCVNCRKMEEKVWSDPIVMKMLKEDFVVVSLYVDDKSIALPANQHFTTPSGQKISMLSDKNAYIEEAYFGQTTQPLYCIIDGNEKLMEQPLGADYFQFKIEPFRDFLTNGKKNFNLNK
jgi:thiol:disulfide interchange protein DsbD